MGWKNQGYRSTLGDFLLADEAAHGIAWLRPNSQPVFHAFRIKLDFRRLFERVVCSHCFHNAAVTGPGPFHYHDTVERFLLFADSGQSNGEHYAAPPGGIVA